MKILYIHQYFSTPEGKCGTRSYEFAKRLVKQGHDVHMLTSSAYLPNVEMSQKKWGHVFLDGIDVHIYNMSYSNAMPFRKRILKYVQFSFFSLFKARKIDYDIVFATSTPLTVGVPGVLSAKSRSVPFVFEVRDLWPEMPVAMGVIKNPLLIYSLKKLESWIYSNSTRVIALSPGMVNGVIATGYNSGQVSMIPNACDVEMFKTDLKKSSAFRNKYSWLEERPMILYAGTLGMINGVSYLVDVAYYLNNIDNEVRVVVIGDGMEKQHIINRAKQKNVWKKNFFLLEPMPKNDLTNAFSAADLSCSLFIQVKEMWSNSANKFFDSLASATPVVINYGGWQADIINNSGCGIVVPSCNANEAAVMMYEKLSNKSWLESAAQNANKLAVNRFNRDVLAKEFESTLLDSLK